MKQRSLRVNLFFILFILLLSKTVFAEVPIPWGAKLIKSDIAVIGSAEERTVASYETKASKQELLNYYLKEMPARGYSLFMNGEQNLVFKKAKELIIVVVPPSRDGKTHFMVCVSPMGNASGTGNPYSAEVKCESISSVPVYPGARCMNSTRLKSSGTMSAAYSANDSANVVLNFYSTQMPRYGWQLAKEFSFEDIMYKLTQEQQSAMTSEQRAGINDFLGGARGVSFTKQDGSGCSVYVMNNLANKGSLLINIIYEEKARK